MSLPVTEASETLSVTDNSLDLQQAAMQCTAYPNDHSVAAANAKRRIDASVRRAANRIFLVPAHRAGYHEVNGVLHARHRAIPSLARLSRTGSVAMLDVGRLAEDAPLYAEQPAA